jgi:hypothetical protein
VSSVHILFGMSSFVVFVVSLFVVIEVFPLIHVVYIEKKRLQRSRQLQSCLATKMIENKRMRMYLSVQTRVRNSVFSY